MKSTTQLDSAVFHLTPTRTRCDLIIIANGKKEKIATGLLTPFLAHLKTAQDQIAKGGYSILLEPDPDSDATWFTKGTVERFVRFVSTPEILERVYTLESEILQIEEAISIQGNNDTGKSIVEEHQSKPATSGEGNKTKPDPNEEKAIVLYKQPEAHQSQTNSECSKEGNSRVQLLKVLETRKTVLRNEQGMAFARAVAASFDLEHMAPLVSLAECFGASRLRDACLRFVDLWKKKHETGQWVEIEAAEAMSSRTDFSAINASGIVLASMANGDLGNNEKPDIGMNAGEKPPVSNQTPSGQQEYFQGQFPHPMFQPWPMNSPPGTMPMFPAYPVQGMPYYQAFPGNVPFYQPPYSPMDDSRSNVTPKTREKRQSVDDKDSQESESGDTDTSNSRSPDGTELGRASRKKAGRSGNKQRGKVVIRNINYITSEAKNPGGGRAESEDDSDTGREGQRRGDDLDGKSSKSSKRRGNHSRSTGESNYDTEENFFAKETEGRNWQAFQSFLLSGADEENHTDKQGLFAMENDGKVRRRQTTSGEDPLALGGRDSYERGDRQLSAIHEANGNISRVFRSNDEVILSGAGTDVANGLNGQMDMQFTETNGRRVSRPGNDDFIIGSREGQMDLRNSSDPLVVSRFERGNCKFDGAASHDIVDESFIVPFRSIALNHVGTGDRTPIDMESEMPSTYQNQEGDGIMRKRVSYEPDDQSMMPERGTEKRAYDPALDYEMLVCGQASVSVENTKEGVTDVKGNAKKSEKNRSLKVSSDSVDKKRTGGPIRKGKPSKMSPLEDARVRADKLRAFKADMQKLKKEKEEADMKRLEALKLGRQKRIAARASCGPAGSAALSPPTKKMPTKLSPISNRGSKFSDLEPGSSSPLQRTKVRTSFGSGDAHKASKSTKLSEGSHLPGNRLSQSVSSLPEKKKESTSVTPESKASMARIRRLSEPKAVAQHSSTTTKARSTEPVVKQKSDGPNRKKISSIINLDKSKDASLPELKIRTPTGSSDVPQNKSAGRDKLKVEEAKPSVTSECSEAHAENPKLSDQTDADDSEIVEKTVVMMEYGKPSVPVLHTPGDKVIAQNSQFQNHGKLQKPEVVSEFVSIRAPPSPSDGIDTLPDRVQEQSTSHEERKSNTVDSSKYLKNNVTEKPYHAPYARVSSVEDASTRNTDYGKALPNASELVPTSKAYVVKEKTYKVDSIPEATVNDMTYRVDSISETSGKNQGKESSKGFRRLLKFGKKSHNSAAGDQSIDLDSASINGLEQQSNTTSNASNEVYTLKNLISEDDTPPGNGSQKSSRHFSLLSPFRSKTSEKKLTT